MFHVEGIGVLEFNVSGIGVGFTKGVFRAVSPARVPAKWSAQAF